MFRFYDLVSKVTLKGTLKNDVRAYMLKKLFQLNYDLVLGGKK